MKENRSKGASYHVQSCGRVSLRVTVGLNESNCSWTSAIIGGLSNA